MDINPYLIALDLDGTLLTSQKTIDRTTASYLRKLSQHHMIVLASGRPYRSMIKYYQQLQLTTPMVCYNGAFVVNPHNKQALEKAFEFPKDVVKKIYLDVGDDYLDNVMCETNEDIWLLQEEHGLADFFWHKNMNMHYGPLHLTLEENPMTMILKSKERNEESDQRIIDAVNHHPGLRVRFWGDSVYSEVYYDHISKGSALQSLLTQYHIPRSHFIAFGDAENDREMLTIAPHSFAMKNAVDSIKKIAKKITRFDHNEKGIVESLKDFFNDH